MMISPGAIVTVKQFGTALWVVKRPASGRPLVFKREGDR